MQNFILGACATGRRSGRPAPGHHDNAEFRRDVVAVARRGEAPIEFETINRHATAA
jgi:hypothetical protein